MLNQSQFLSILSTALVLFIIYALYNRPNPLPSLHLKVSITGRPNSSQGLHTHTITEVNGVANVTGWHLGTDEDFGIKDLCGGTRWTNGLWLYCHSYCGPNETSVCGGLNNARNRLQTCLRLAIDAGSGLILPTVTTRDEKNIANTNAGVVCPEVFWDMSHLEEAMREQCPQLELRFCGNTSGIDKTLRAPTRGHLSAAHYNGSFSELVTSVLDASNITKIDAFNPIAVEFGDPYLGWNYAEAGELSTIRKGLFKALPYNPDLLAIGLQILQSPEISNGFIGVHLRGEDDWPAMFGSADEQIRLYTAELQAQSTIPSETRTVYVSCGSETAIGRLRENLLPFGYTVHDKWTLLSNRPDILQQIEGLGFDEKAIPEYQVLVNAKYWLGIISSSMSSLIAYARTLEDEEDYFTTYILPGSARAGVLRIYPDAPVIRGNNFTKLILLNGVDIIDMFP